MTMIQYNVQAGANGSILIPTTPFAFGEEVEVVLRVPKEENDDQTKQRQKAAGQRFFDTWNGLLEGMPDMTMKEVRAERLERKYGQ